MICLSVDEVERRFALLGIANRFSKEEKNELNTTPIVTDQTDVFLFPTPRDNEGLNILKLRYLLGTDPLRQPAFFDHPWYLDEAFALRNCASGWHGLYTNVLPASVSQPIYYADSLKLKGLELPSAVEVALMLFLQYSGTGIQLLQKKHTWCNDVATMHRRVTVGAFGRNGLFVSGHPPEFTSRGLGICAKLMRVGDT